MNRVLELSKKIYEAGFEPDMTARSSKGSTNIYLTIGKPDMQEDIKSFFNIYPWFSADWCWKIIPKKILYSEKYGYIKYLTIDQKGLHYGKEPYFEIEDYSLHEGLLEAIWWCIDNGHIKAVK